MTSSIQFSISRRAARCLGAAGPRAMSSPIRARLCIALITLAFLWFAGEPAGASASWQVVPAAEEDAELVFDNATREVSRRLTAAGVPAGNIHRLSASAAELASGVEPA